MAERGFGPLRRTTAGSVAWGSGWGFTPSRASSQRGKHRVRGSHRFAFRAFVLKGFEWGSRLGWALRAPPGKVWETLGPCGSKFVLSERPQNMAVGKTKASVHSYHNICSVEARYG